MTQKTARSLADLAVEQVKPSLRNPRHTLAKEALAELKKSIAKNGLLQPIAVRAVEDGYEIVGGHRRYHAVKELAHEHPNDPRFATIAALVVDAGDQRVAAMRLAENINRADLSPLEIAEGVADALENGMTEEELAESLGWAKRNIYRYKQFHDAPGWLKAFATEVPLASRKLDEHGAPVLDVVTDAPVHNVEKLAGLEFTHLFELLTFYNLLHDADRLELDERGGEKFRPQAERTIKKLARAAAKEEWSIAKLRTEIKRAKDPKPTPPAPSIGSDAKTSFVITAQRAGIELTRAERDALASQVADTMHAFGFKDVVVSDRRS